jgi:predicted GIY-YIG superfamily endonuclease
MRSNQPGIDHIKDALLMQLSDIKMVMKALRDFEVPDDLTDMFVYAIREEDTGNIKLGISRNPEARLKQLQTGNSSKLTLVGYREAKNKFKDEKALHQRNEALRIHGEWFSSEVQNTINA